MKLRKLAVFLLASVFSCSALFTPVSARDVSNGSIPIKVEEYDHETNQITEKTIYINPSETPPAIPDSPAMETYGLIGTTDRRTRVDPTKAPYDGIAYLDLRYNSAPTQRVGTGFLISPNVIVTAAHTLKDIDNKWVKSYTVYIGNQKRTVKKTFVPADWSANNHLVKDDYAVIILNEYITDATQFTLSTAAAGTGEYTVAGYCFWDGGFNLYKHSGTVYATTDSEGSPVYRYQIDEIGGQSGGPVYNRSNKVIGINAYEIGGDDKPFVKNEHTGYKENCSCNEAVRITSSIKGFFDYYVNQYQ